MHPLRRHQLALADRAPAPLRLAEREVLPLGLGVGVTKTTTGTREQCRESFIRRTSTRTRKTRPGVLRPKEIIELLCSAFWGLRHRASVEDEGWEGGRHAAFCSEPTGYNAQPVWTTT